MSHPVFAVVGHPNKGKSSIVATLASDDTVRIGPEAGTTVQCRRYPMIVDGVELYTLVDTPGFQRARRALQWMQRQETTADRHTQVVRQFVETHRDAGEFSDECELLQPILEGAGILYVVDGGIPYGEEYEPEMEILRWTGQPSLALINPIGKADYIEPWQAALGQYFRVVRAFDAVQADFEKKTELLRAFGQLQETWRAPLDHAVKSIVQDRHRRRRNAARILARWLSQMLQHTLDLKLPVEGDLRAARPRLEQQFRQDLVRMEQEQRDEVELLYDHRRLKRREVDLQFLEEDLFTEGTWLRFGLRKRELIAVGTVGGAAAGGVLDLAVGGSSLLMGTLVGGSAGALTAWWTSKVLVKVTVMNLPLGGKRLVAGPTKNLNFPFVILNRARYHHYRVSQRNHSVRGAVILDDLPDWLELSRDQRDRLAKLFKRSRKANGDSTVTEALADVISEILVADEKRGG